MQYWEMTYQELALSGLGNQALMSMPKVAFLLREWTEPLTQGHLTIVSQVLTKSRLTKPLTLERNALAAQMAETIVVTHASTGGSL